MNQARRTRHFARSAKSFRASHEMPRSPRLAYKALVMQARKTDYNRSLANFIHEAQGKKRDSFMRRR